MDNLSFEMMIDRLSEYDKIDSELIANIRLLNSENKKVREEAEEELFRRSYHQGDIGVVAPIVIPFFISRLDRETNSRILQSLLIELGCLASGSSRAMVMDDFEQEYTEVDRIQILEAIELFSQTQNTIVTGLNRYCQFLSHESAMIRNSAVYVLMYCQFQVENIIHVLRSAFEKENDENIKSLILFGIVISSTRNQLNIDTVFLNDIVSSSATDFVKFSASVALAYVEEENISEVVFAKLLELSKKDGMWETLRYLESSLPFSILYFVSRLNDEQTFQLVDAMIQGWSLDISTDELINLVFKCEDEEDFWEPRDINSISSLQLFFLTKVVETENVRYGSTLGSLLRTFSDQGYHEPTRETLIKLLSRRSN